LKRDVGVDELIKWDDVDIDSSALAFTLRNETISLIV